VIEGLTLFVPAWHIVLPTASWDTLLRVDDEVDADFAHLTSGDLAR